MNNVDLKPRLNRISLLNCRYLGSFPSDYVSTVPKETFAIIHAQPSSLQVEHWIMIANSCHSFILWALVEVKFTVSSSSSSRR